MFKVNAKYEGHSTKRHPITKLLLFLEIGVAKTNGDARILLGC